MTLSLIVAAARNDVIGVDGELPWHLPDDFAWFKRTTMGKPIVMGRKTWESIGKPLPGRQNIVITRQTGFGAVGADVVATPQAAIDVAGSAEEVMVIGGAQVYAAFLPEASRIYLTRVDAAPQGDALFPPIDEDEWRLVSSESHAADERHAYPFEFRVYERSTDRGE